MTSDDKNQNKEDQVTGLSLDDDAPAEEVADKTDNDSSDVSGGGDAHEGGVEQPPIMKETAVLSAQKPEQPEDISSVRDEVGEEPDFDVDMEAMDAETLDDMESDVHITGDESVDFAEDMGSGDSRYEMSAKPSGGGSAKLIAPFAVIILAAGIGGYIVMNPDILGGGGSSGGATTVPPAIVVPENIENNLVELDAVVPQPVASENPSPRMPQNAQVLEDTLVEEDFAEQSAVSQTDAVDNDQDSDLFSADLEQELASLEAQPKNLDESAMTGNSVIEQGSADSVDAPAELVVLEDNGTVDEDEDIGLSLTEDASSEPAAGESEIVLAENEATPPVMPDLAPEVNAVAADAQPANSGGFSENVSDVAATRTEQSKNLIESDSDTYYDSRSSTLPPVGNEAASAGLRKVDPVMEPASQYVVVNKDKSANDYEARLVAAKRALVLKRYDSALEMYDALYDRNKRDPRVLMGLAVAQQNSGMTEAAIRTYDDLLAIDKNNADAMTNMLGLLKEQYPAVALRRLLELFEDYPRNALIAAQIGVAYADQGDTSQAFKYLGIATSLDPNNAQHLFNIAIIADRAGKRSEAVKYYEKALEADAVYGSGRSIPRETIYDRLATLRR